MKSDPCRKLDKTEYQSEYKGWDISLDGSGLYTVTNGIRFWQWHGNGDPDSDLTFIKTIIDAR